MKHLISSGIGLSIIYMYYDNTMDHFSKLKCPIHGAKLVYISVSLNIFIPDKIYVSSRANTANY